jgi:hypothetical protein
MARKKHPLHHPPEKLHFHDLNDDNRIFVHCTECLRETNHRLLLTVSKKPNGPFLEVGPNETLYEIIQCRGCDSVSMIHRQDEGGSWAVEYYPSRVSRQLPPWIDDIAKKTVGGNNGAHLASLLREIYRATANNNYRLVAMGIRAILEQVMVEKAQDQGSFSRNLECFYKEGYISFVQRDQVEAVLQVGHAAIHRMFAPEKSDVDALLDITESVLSAIYINTDISARVADRVPKRPARLNKPS